MALAPGYGEFHRALGQALARGGALPEALAELDAAAALEARSAACATDDRGHVLQLLGRQAEAAYRRAAELAR